MALLTVKQVQGRLASEEYLGRVYPEDTLRYWIRTGQLARVPAPGRAILVDADSLRPYLRKKRRRWWGAA